MMVMVNLIQLNNIQMILIPMINKLIKTDNLFYTLKPSMPSVKLCMTITIRKDMISVRITITEKNLYFWLIRLNSARDQQICLSLLATTLNVVFSTQISYLTTRIQKMMTRVLQLKKAISSPQALWTLSQPHARCT